MLQNRQLYSILSKYLNMQRIRFAEEDLKIEMLSDKNESIIAITNSLDYLKIPYTHFTLKLSSESLKSLPNQFFCQINVDTILHTVLVTKLKENIYKVEYDYNQSFNFSDRFGSDPCDCLRIF